MSDRKSWKREGRERERDSVDAVLFSSKLVIIIWKWSPPWGQTWYNSMEYIWIIKLQISKFTLLPITTTSYCKPLFYMKCLPLPTFSKHVFMCIRMFVVQQIPESNLLMLVVQADCDCSRQYPPITMQPEEVKYILWCYITFDTAVVCIGYNGNSVPSWSDCCFFSTPSYIMPQSSVTGWGHRRFVDGRSPAMPTTLRSASHYQISQNYFQHQPASANTNIFSKAAFDHSPLNQITIRHKSSCLTILFLLRWLYSKLLDYDLLK